MARLLLVLALCFAPLPAYAAPTRIPAELCLGYFFVPVTLAGDESRARTLWFLFDTGASVTHVDPDSLERASGQRPQTGARAAIRDATAGPLRFARLPARISELDHLSLVMGREIDGILGFAAFDRFLLTLDYPAGEMRIARGALPAPDGVSVFSARGRDARPWIDVRLGGETRSMLIDSGARTGFSVNALDALDTAAPPRVVGAAARFNRMETRRGARLAADVFVGPHRFERPIVEETPGSELIGSESLRHFVLTFDQQRRRVRIERAVRTPITFAPLRNHGLVMSPAGDRLRVDAVIEGGNGDMAAGDYVSHIDGARIAERGCTPAGEDAVTVTRQRGGESADIELTMRILVE